MRAPLLRKELREHRWQLLIVLILVGIGLLTLALDSDNDGGSYLDIVRRFSIFFVPLASWRVAQRLITREYSARTQLFLEVLPVTRVRVLATKWLLGAAFVIALLAGTIAFSLLLARHHELVDRRRLAFVSVRAISFALLVYAVFATTALLGRYRVALGLFALFAVISVSERTNIDLTKVGPLRLVSDDLAYARDALPRAALFETWAFTAGLIALAFVLVQLREGSVQAMLSQRMSHREKVFFGCVFVGMMVAFATLDDIKDPKPFHIESGEVVTRDGVDVHVALDDEAGRPAAHALADHEAQVLADAKAWLGIQRLPPLSLIPSAELDTDVFERAKLDERDGLVIRARFDAPDFPRAEFDAWLLQRVLEWAAHEEPLPEDRTWVAEGFAWWWVARSDPGLQRALDLRERYALTSPPTWKMLATWLTTSERLGPCLSGAVAAGALETLHAQLGDAKFQAFARAALAWRSPRDFRVLWQRRRTEALLRAQGITPDAMAHAWSDRLARPSPELQTTLAAIARPSAELEVKALGTSAREARYRLHASGAVTLLYATLPPVDYPIAVSSLTPELVPTPDTGWHALPRTFPVGSRMVWTASVPVPALGCHVWTGLRRQVIR